MFIKKNKKKSLAATQAYLEKSEFMKYVLHYFFIALLHYLLILYQNKLYKINKNVKTSKLDSCPKVSSLYGSLFLSQNQAILPSQQQFGTIVTTLLLALFNEYRFLNRKAATGSLRESIKKKINVEFMYCPQEYISILNFKTQC